MSKNSDKNNKDPDRPKRIAKTAEDVANSLDELHKKFATTAQEYGYARDVFHDVASKFYEISDHPVFSSAEKTIIDFRNFIDVKKKHIEKIDFDVSSSAYVLSTAVTASTGLSILDFSGTWGVIEDYPRPPSFWAPDREELYASKLDKLDPELGKLYRSVWESFYGGSSEQERAALHSMRQLFDHFFHILAPDNEVRNSSYFTEKEGEDPYKIHRHERVKYAGNERIQDKEAGKLLAAQADHMTRLYKKLNKVHKRGLLKRKETRNILRAMQTAIESWIDAMKV